MESPNTLAKNPTASELDTRDLQASLELLPREIFGLLQIYANKVFLIGGLIRHAINREPINDIDLACRDPEAYANVVAKLHRDGSSGKGRYTYTFKHFRPLVQLSHYHYYSSPSDVIGAADFSMAGCAVYHDGNQFRGLCHPSFYADLAAKRLTYLTPPKPDPYGSLYRAIKMCRKGYSLDQNSLAGILSGLHEENAKERDVLTPVDRRAHILRRLNAVFPLQNVHL